MAEREDVLQELGGSGVLDGIRWAHATAYGRMLDDYDSDAGHDQAWIGTTAYKFLLDRQDRVFSCEKYRVDEDGDTDTDGTVGLDVLGAGLRHGELDAMPTLPPTLVSRHNLNQSPGWRVGYWRWLLASCPFGTAKRIQWSQKSQTKQKVADTPNPDQLLLTDLVIPGLEDVVAVGAASVGDPATLVLAHSVNGETGEGELLLGRPRRNDKGGSSWWWTIDLLDGQAPGSSGRRPSSPTGPDGNGPTAVPDAPVRLRRPGKTGGTEA